ncbi:hypothetical protein [Zobellia laminariae]|uniref:hypothetical protein n=1 Tax=Zobellia laminariae TaxID=248906 RepID=UPI0034CF2558
MTVPTKSALKKVLKKKYVEVDGVIATTATYIQGGENITLSIPNETDSSKKLIFPLNVLFEDKHLALIHKPGAFW